MRTGPGNRGPVFIYTDKMATSPPVPREGEIVAGEASEVMARMPESIVDLVVTSPPYDDLRKYDGYRFCVRSIGEGLFRVMRPGGIVVWVVGDKIRDGNRSLTSFKQGLAFQEMGFLFHDLMIYAKNATPWPRPRAYRNVHELMFVLRKPGGEITFNPLKEPNVWAGSVVNKYAREGPREELSHKGRTRVPPERTRGNIWTYDPAGGKGATDSLAYSHPATFPEALARDHILSWSNPGDLVLDPMCGAGTTLKMAAVHGRRWMGIDISPRYAELSAARVRMFASRLDLS